MKKIIQDHKINGTNSQGGASCSGGKKEEEEKCVSAAAWRTSIVFCDIMKEEQEWVSVVMWKRRR